MAAAHITDVRLNAAIGPQHVRWPAETASPVWKKLHHVVASAKAVVKEVDKSISTLEEDRDLADAARIRKIGEAGLSAINSLLRVTKMIEAQAAVDALVAEAAENTTPQSPGGEIPKSEDPAAREIRDFCRTQKKFSPTTWALAHRSDPRVFAAIAGAPGFLSGLTKEQHEKFVGDGIKALRPSHVTDAIKAAEQAHHAVDAAERLIFERAQAGLLKTSKGYAVKGPKGSFTSTPVLPRRAAT